MPVPASTLVRVGIQPYGGATFDSVGTVDSIADLKAFSVSGLGAGYCMQVNGYYAALDGGGGIFRYDPASSTTVNLGTVFAPNSGGGRWKRVFSGAVNVRWFGAKGDNATNDYTSLAAAIAYAVANTGAVYVPRGEYVYGTSLTMSSLVSIIGDGVDTSIFRYSGNSHGFNFAGSVGSTIVKTRLEAFALYGNGSASAGLNLAYTDYSSFRDLRIYGFVNGIAFDNSYDNHLEQVLCEACTQDGFNFGADANNNSLIHCMAFSNTRAGFFIEGSRQLALIDCNAEANQYNVYISATVAKKSHKISIIGGYYEGATGQSILIQSTAGAGVAAAQCVTIRDAYFVSLTANIQAIRVRDCQGLTIDSCHFSDVGTAFQYSLYLPGGGLTANIVWGVNNLDQSTTGIFAGSAYKSVDIV